MAAKSGGNIRGHCRKTEHYLKLSLVLTLAVSIVYWVILYPLYGINDDTGMMGIAYGIYGENYENHLVYINVILGTILKLLVLFRPGIPWYAILQCILIFLSFATIFYLLIEAFTPKGAALPILVVAIYFAYDYFARPQFTQTAGVACIAGGCCMFSAIIHQKKPAAYFYSGALLLLGSLYRFIVFELIMAFMFVVGAYYVISIRKFEDKRHKILSCFLPFFCVVCLSFLCVAVNNLSYQKTDEWRKYREYNSLRANLLDYGFPPYDENKELYTSLNMTPDDIMMFQNFNFADPDIFNIASMKKLADAKTSSNKSNSILTFVRNMLSGWTSYNFFPTVIIAFVLLILGGPKNKEDYILCCLLTFLFVVVNYYLFCKGRYLVRRVDINVFLCMFLTLILYCWKGDQIDNLKYYAISALVVLIVALPKINTRINQNFQEGKTNANLTKETESLFSLLNSDKSKLYLAQTFAIDNPSGLWYVPKFGSKENVYGLGGWGTMLPVREKNLYSHNIRNPYRDSVNNGDVYFICKSTQNIDASVSYIRRHYAADAVSQLVKVTGNGYQVFRILSGSTFLDTSRAEFRKDFLKSFCSVTRTEDGYQVNGQLYAPGINSFSSNIYVEALLENGTKRVYCATQTKNKNINDIYNGEYGPFHCKMTGITDIRAVTLYYEADKRLYRTGEKENVLFTTVSEDRKHIKISMSGDDDLESVRFPVWGADNGQDDLSWYDAREEEDNLWRSTVNLDDHDNSKKFVVHVYGYRKDSSEANFITGTTVSIPDIEAGST